MLSVAYKHLMQNVVMLSVIMLSAVAPFIHTVNLKPAYKTFQYNNNIYIPCYDQKMFVLIEQLIISYSSSTSSFISLSDVNFMSVFPPKICQSKCCQSKWRHDIQHNDTQRKGLVCDSINDTQHN
jgi:hypothetical protein